jgi:phospholipid-binding lipoprotein MlaA
MKLRKPRRAALWLAASAMLLGGCATTGADSAAAVNPDPLERLNRGVFAFNQAADKVVARPVARGYRAVMPPLVRTGITNFFDTLSVPRTLFNNLLQGKPKAAGQDLARLLLNLTVGLGGLIDVASREGLAKNNEDFGQTLAVWGLGPGPYLMVPVLGAYTLRAGFGELGDWPLRPIAYVDDSDVRLSVEILYLVHLRSQLLATDSLVDSALDPYLLVREAYFQRRQFLIYDGNPPEADLFDDDEFLDEEFDEDAFFDGK